MEKVGQIHSSHLIPRERTSSTYVVQGLVPLGLDVKVKSKIAHCARIQTLNIQPVNIHFSKLAIPATIVNILKREWHHIKKYAA
jgi:hypothetical protein